MKIALPPSYIDKTLEVAIGRYLDEDRYGSSRAGRAGRVILTVLGLLTPAEQDVVRAYPYGKMRGVMTEAVEQLKPRSCDSEGP